MHNGNILKGMAIPMYWCPSSPLSRMAITESGRDPPGPGGIAAPHYAGISGGIDPAFMAAPPDLFYDNDSFRDHWCYGIKAASGMLIPEVFPGPALPMPRLRVTAASARDGLSNTLLIGEQSDWLLDGGTQYEGRVRNGHGFTYGIELQGGQFTSRTWQLTGVRYPINDRTFHRPGVGLVPRPGSLFPNNQPVQSAHAGGATEPRAGRTGCLGIRGPARRREQEPLDLGQEDLRERRDGSGLVGKHAPQPLRHRDHPLPHGHRRDDVIGEVGGRLGHVAAVAGRADAAALAGEGHDESRAARHADRAGEPEAEEPAREIAADFVLDVSWHGPLLGFQPLEPVLEVLRDDLVERRLLGPTPLVAAGRRGAAMGAASDSRGKSCDRGDHGRTGWWTAGVNGRTLSAERRGSPPAVSQGSVVRQRVGGMCH